MKINWKDILSFRRMITPLLIQMLFWIGIGISVLAGIAIFFFGTIGGISDGGFGSIIGGIIGGLIGGLLVILLGILGVRIYAELLILAFRINETLTDIKNLLEKE